MRARHLVHRVHLERDLHPAHAGEALISTGTVAPFGFSNSSAGPPCLHGAVGELGDLEIRVHFERNALQFAVLRPARDELAQIAICHMV